MQAVLGRDGFAGLTTREVARTAGVPLSQIHYHFGSKQGLFLALLDHLDRQLLERQQRMFASDAPLSAKWREACDFLDDDMDSGYVRLLQEAIAQGWSDPAVAEKVRQRMSGWTRLLAEVASQAEPALGGLGPFSAAEVASLVGAAFIGAESKLLLGLDESRFPLRSALRKVGDVIEIMEKRKGGEG
jgi:AcrR family transcriptional regulator